MDQAIPVAAFKSLRQRSLTAVYHTASVVKSGINYAY